jgi:hypothetical protein
MTEQWKLVTVTDAAFVAKGGVCTVAEPMSRFKTGYRLPPYTGGPAVCRFAGRSKFRLRWPQARKLGSTPYHPKIISFRWRELSFITTVLTARGPPAWSH